MGTGSTLLSFEVDANAEQLFIHADPAGLRGLAKRLERLASRVEQQGADHDHLFSDEWGDGDLSSQPQAEGNRAIHHVKVLAWPAPSSDASGACNV